MNTMIHLTSQIDMIIIVMNNASKICVGVCELVIDTVSTIKVTYTSPRRLIWTLQTSSTWLGEYKCYVYVKLNNEVNPGKHIVILE